LENGEWIIENGFKIINFYKKLIFMLKLAHKNLEVYQIALNLVKEVYHVTEKFPKEEQFVLVSQLRRAVISVCSNLAEGSARYSKAEKKRFYEISRSSLVEVDTQFEISLILEYLQKKGYCTIGKLPGVSI
jgi:four helix bundle protein